MGDGVWGVNLAEPFRGVVLFLVRPDPISHAPYPIRNYFASVVGRTGGGGSGVPLRNAA